jgi:hypothetical protein
MEYVEEVLTKQKLSTLGSALGIIDTYFKDVYYSDKIKENQIAVIEGKLFASGLFGPYPLRGKEIKLYVDGEYRKSTRTSENGDFRFELTAQELGGVGRHKVKIAYEPAWWELDKSTELTLNITVEEGYGIPGKKTPIKFENIMPALMVAGAVLPVAIVSAVILLKKKES